MDQFTSIKRYKDLDGGASNLVVETSYTYDNIGRLTDLTHFEDTTTFSDYGWTYDSFSRVTAFTYSHLVGGSGSSTYSYDHTSQVTAADHSGQTDETYTYDSAGNRTISGYTTGANNRLTSDGVFNFTYDDEGNRITQTRISNDPADDKTTEYTYDHRNRLTSVVYKNNAGTVTKSVAYVYDVWDRRIEKSFDADGAAASNLTSETDPLGNVTAYQYDNLYRVKKLIEPDPDGGGSATTLFAYDAVGNRTSLTDPVGNVTGWAYDNLDRTISETNDLSDVRTFEYDAASNLVKKTDRNGRVTEYDYDNLHRRTAEIWKDGVNTVRTIGYAYDAASQLTEATDPAATYDFTYDNLGRAIEVASDTAALDVVLTQEFNAAGWRTALGAEVNSTGDLEDRFFYDNLGRLTKIERDSAPEIRIDFAYNAAGQFTSIKRYKDLDGGSGNLVVETSYAYDGIGRLTDLTHFEDTTTFADHEYDFDANSRVTDFAFSHLVGGSGTAEYVYDNTSQLTGADHSSQTDETYTYDASGNRTISGYTTGDANRLTSDGVWNFTYDDEGNRITDTRISSAQADDKTIEYAYDHRNRLTSVTDVLGFVTSFAYE